MDKPITRSDEARMWVLRIATFLGAILILVLAVVLYWLVFPHQLIEADNPTTGAQTYKPGGPVDLHYDQFCVTESKAISVQRVAVSEDNGQRINLLPYSFDEEFVPATCYEDLQTSIPLPAEMDAGLWRLEVRITYQPSPVRTDTQVFTTNVFTVTE